MRIRLAVLKDLSEIREIYNDAVINTTATFDIEPRTVKQQEEWFLEHGGRYPVIVYEIDGKVAGWASLSRWNERPAYANTVENSIYVKKEYRRNGIGRELLRELIKYSYECKHHTIIARIAEGNETSIKMHREAGFEIIGVMKEAGRKFGRYIDVTIMQKIL
jgi:L-amino acid N-acyltransferase